MRTFSSGIALDFGVRSRNKRIVCNPLLPYPFLGPCLTTPDKLKALTSYYSLLELVQIIFFYIAHIRRNIPVSDEHAFLRYAYFRSTVIHPRGYIYNAPNTRNAPVL